MFQRGDQVACAGIRRPPIRRWREMQHDFGQTADTFQARWLIQIGKHRACAMAPPIVGLIRITQQDIQLIAPVQTRQGAARDIAASDNQ